MVVIDKSASLIVEGELVDDSDVMTTVEEVLQSHLTVFAAEASRKEGRVVDCQTFEHEARGLVAAAKSTS